ncbi:MAG: DUF4397 domain-containing protein [Terriglobales bacterium]|jgi:hypothetical protein
MSRWLKALPLSLALAALGIVATSCGSSNQAQIRFVHAIQDAPALDIAVYGPQQIDGMQLFADIGFRGFLPSAGYENVFSDTDMIEGFVNPTDTTSVFSAPVNWDAGLHYTVIATGVSATGANGSNVVLQSILDDNSPPASGSVEFRVINASPHSPPGGVDVYIDPIPVQAMGSAVISGLAYQQVSEYVSLVFFPGNNSNNGNSGYELYVTQAGKTTPIFSQYLGPADNTIHTLVLTDIQGGNAMNPLAMELTDLD